MSQPAVFLHNAADINPLFIRVATRWTLPRIEIHADALPARVVQLAQHRIVQLSEACNCLLGEVLGGTILLGGSFMVWVATQSWRDVGLVVVAALYAGLIGKAVSVAWTRVRLLLVLNGLRRRLGAAESFGNVASPQHAKAEPGLYMGREPPKLSARIASATEGEDLVSDQEGSLPSLSDMAERPRVVLRQASDVERFALQVLAQWKLPRVEVRVDELPALDAQRAQHRILHLASACNCVLGGTLAAATLLAGSFYVIWVPNQTWVWTTPPRWDLMGLVVVFTLCAALIGTAIEIVWTRVKLLRVLRELRSRLGALETRT